MEVRSSHFPPFTHVITFTLVLVHFAHLNSLFITTLGAEAERRRNEPRD